MMMAWRVHPFGVVLFLTAAVLAAVLALWATVAVAGEDFGDSVDARQTYDEVKVVKDTVYEVAFLLGYSEPSTFFRAFRRWHGITPKEYRGRQTNTFDSSPSL